MPSGTYLLSGPDGPFARERFASAPGPLGWRYAATREHPVSGAPLGGLDLVLDARGRVLRLQMTAAGWELRGGAVGDAQVLWLRGDVEQAAVAEGFTGTSPAFALAAVRRLRPGSAGVRGRFAHVGDDALAVVLVDRIWRSAGPAFEVDDLATGERGTVLIEGDVVRSAPGAVLAALDRGPDAGLGPVFHDRPGERSDTVVAGLADFGWQR